MQTFQALYPAILEQPIPNRPDLIRKKIQKDVVLTSTLTGIVLGQMTVEEINAYWVGRTALAKRLRTMLTERLIDALMSN